VIIDGRAKRPPTEYVVTGREAELKAKMARKEKKLEKAQEELA